MRSLLIPDFDFGREFDELFSSMFSSPARDSWLPSVESHAKDGKVELRMDLPGVDPKEVEISLDGSQSSDPLGFPLRSSCNFRQLACAFLRDASG